MSLTAQKSANLLIVTDLDATLLDHQTYSYKAAMPAIEQLKDRGCPIIFNSSKTRAEQALLRAELGLEAPFIVENGSAVIVPAGQLGERAEQVKVFGLAYAELVAKLNELRSQQNYQFRGFSDLDAAELAEITGLSLDRASAAKQRSAAEPLEWQDSEAAYEQFVEEVTALGLKTTQGGRFRHVMAHSDKGKALKWLTERYRAVFPQTQWTVVALGDSPNDVPMLQAADIGVLIPNPHRAPFEISGVKHLVRPAAAGPAGWAEAIAHIFAFFNDGDHEKTA